MGPDDAASFSAQLIAYYVEAGMDNTPSEATRAVYWRRLEEFDAATVFHCMETIWEITVGAENGRGGRKLYTSTNRPTPAQLADHVRTVSRQRTADERYKKQAEETRLLEAEIADERERAQARVVEMKDQYAELARRSAITTTKGSHDKQGGYTLSDMETRLHPLYCTVPWLENEVTALQRQLAFASGNTPQENKDAVDEMLGHEKERKPG